jgi:hypothetical protein
MPAPHPWHALLAPLPAEAAPRRRPVAPPGIAAAPGGEAIAGWTQLSVELSAGPAGLRAILVVLDGSDRVVAASDHVLVSSRAAPGDVALMHRHESLGGRFEEDGAFHGTRWSSLLHERTDGTVDQQRATPSPPSPAEEAALRELVAAVLRAAGVLPPA